MSNKEEPETVSFETARKLRARGWALMQTVKGYSKFRSRSYITNYSLTEAKMIGFRIYDAPNESELRSMMEKVDYMNEESLPVNMLADKFMAWLTRHKTRLEGNTI